MVVLILERVTPGLRGELTRWLIEPRANVFVGRISALVRDRLWEKICKGLRAGSSATLIYAADNEQGYAIRQEGEATRLVRDFEGIFLITTP